MIIYFLNHKTRGQPLKKINIGIVGYGVVGSSVVKILDKDREIITQKSGLDINVKKVYTRNWNRKIL
jgi:homoserine dehydrogenase